MDKAEEFAKALAQQVSKTKSGYSVNPLDDIDWDEDDDLYVIQNYRGYDIDKHRDGWIVELAGDEIYCNTIEEAQKTIDEYLDEEE